MADTSTPRLQNRGLQVRVLPPLLAVEGRLRLRRSHDDFNGFGASSQASAPRPHRSDAAAEGLSKRPQTTRGLWRPLVVR